MNFFKHILAIAGSGATAYISARNLRDMNTRPNMLAGLQLAESNSVPLLETLSQRAASEGDDWLAERLQRHANDERRHGQIFASGLRNLNKQVMSREELQQRSDQQKKTGRQQSPFLAAYFEGYSQDDLKAEVIEWPVFFGSTYILELDASKDFVRMAHALPATEPHSVSLKKAILGIAKDEEGHAAYLFDAMVRRYSYFDALKLADEWRERKTNALLAMVRGFMERQGEMPSLVKEYRPEGNEPDTISTEANTESNEETPLVAAS
jgi:hypothetical protein